MDTIRMTKVADRKTVPEHSWHQLSCGVESQAFSLWRHKQDVVAGFLHYHDLHCYQERLESYQDDLLYCFLAMVFHPA
jgi:hypothetical protein